MPQCLICESECNGGYASGNNHFHFICYHYLRNDRDQKSYEGIDDAINNQIIKYYQDNIKFLKRIRRFRHFLFRTAPKEIRQDVENLRTLQEKLQERTYYNAFRNRRLSKLYDYWERYDFDEKGLPPDWPIRRANRLKEDEYTCQDCGIDAKEENVILHVHHKEVRGDGGVYNHTQENLVTLCIDCHKNRHGGHLDLSGQIGLSGKKPFVITDKYRLIERIIEDNRDREENEKTCILILYRNRLKDISRRAILPAEKTHEILLNGNNPYWYVKGHCYLQNEYRRFRISRIIEIEEINQNQIPAGGGEFL